MRLKFLSIFVSLYLILASECCRNVELRQAISYRLKRIDAKATDTVITRRKVPNLGKCKDFAESKQALAFNYVKDMSKRNSEEPNCILYYCPETSGFSNLLNVSGFLYFSSYAEHPYSGNRRLFCIESVGLFVISFEKQNFTNARAACQEMHGFLADVTSEARTNGLASFIGEFHAYVGLSNEKNERIWKNELGDAVSCFEYRAWDTGDPSHSRGCVALFRVSRKSDPVWKVVPCATKFPYICEIPRYQDQNCRCNTTVTIL